ncbi:MULTISPECIES: hypothetical protein [unclassified Bosea (in: a-proteobacteria)]|jgi:hypothetical protein|uniref:hypothetical protein n=1 Tax=unclassified Bosea (in: a-proteobacteria) TaxID=2653178 RepID=UPI00095643BD|nr:MULTISPECIES: hypothetical protein [unclassified Bosea (in: a-proteobacteria)]TAJ28207.1 MAG: hypothetical protein EPO59_19460 [Bosea sp. (in: a-proteobacteria)]SIR38542.1 hypothetical protein SAMN05880592_11851 [Bosea sp. TND4EK4]
MRSRFRVLPLVSACALLLGSCANDFGYGIADLPASAGWQPLPIGAWVLNDGLEARAMVFCPRDVCIRPGFAALVAFEGERGRRMEQALSEDPAQLARAFARLAAEKSAERAAERQRAGRKPLPPAPERSLTSYVRLDSPDSKGVMVTIRAKTTARQGVTAILYGWQGDRLLVALGVSDEIEAAKQDAQAAWRSR